MNAEPSRSSLFDSAARYRPILVLLTYALLALIMTWPLAAELGQRIPGSGGDALVHLWTFDWVKDALSSGNSPFYTTRLFFPEGASLIFHNFAWLHIAAWWPLQALFGGPAAYTLVFFAIFTLNGFATYLLGRDVTRREGAAFVGGLICAFWPYILTQHNHPNLIFVAFIPLALLYLGRLFEYGRLRDALLAGLFIALIGIARWQMLVIGGIIIGFFVLYELAAAPANRTPDKLKLLAAAAGVAVLLMTPLLAPVLTAQFTRENPEDLFVEEELEQTDLMAYLVPSRYHPLWGDAVLPLVENFDANEFFVPFLGYATLLLAVIGVFTTWPASRFWLLAAVLIMILALGPRLLVNGQEYFSMPYKAVEDFFLIRIVRRPDRFNAVLSIPMAMLAALGVRTLQEKVTGRAPTAVLIGVLSLAILSEYIVTFPTLSVAVPDWYQELKDDPDTYGILGVPMHPRSFFDKKYMMFQLANDKPIVEGHISRPLAESYEFIDSVPLLSSLHRLHPARPPDVVDVTGQMDRLAEAGIRYLVLHKSSLLDEELSAWREWLALPPQHEDAELVVYETGAFRDEGFAFEQVAAGDDAGNPQLGLVNFSLIPLPGLSGVQLDAVWGAAAPPAVDYDVCLVVVGDSGGEALRRCRPLSADFPTSSWQKNEVVHGRYDFSLGEELLPGSYSLALTVADALDGSPSDQLIPLGGLTLSSPQTADARWQNGIRLPGYEIALLSGAAEHLRLRLSWLTDEPLDTSYKVFVHLLDAGGEIAAQQDVIPGAGARPTTTWIPGETVEDVIEMPLGDLAPGEYWLTIGLYGETTGERLPVESDAGDAYAARAVPLSVVNIP